MNYRVGDQVKVVPHRRRFSMWPFRRFGLPRMGFPYGQAKGFGTVVEVIEPSTARGITNQGGYQVQLANGTLHYYSEAELRPTAKK